MWLLFDTLPRNDKGMIGRRMQAEHVGVRFLTSRSSIVWISSAIVVVIVVVAIVVAAAMVVIIVVIVAPLASRMVIVVDR